ALVEHDADRSRNGDDSHDSRMATTAIIQEWGIALTWWKSYVKTVTLEVAYAITWKTLKKMMTDKYCPRGKIMKLEIKMWNLNVKGTDVNQNHGNQAGGTRARGMVHALGGRETNQDLNNMENDINV
nr:reverse transcriptase domain-containing protein [Tanacetum cinerariifolium]